MTELEKRKIRKQDRFHGIKPFKRIIKAEAVLPRSAAGVLIPGSTDKAETMPPGSADKAETQTQCITSVERLESRMQELTGASHAIALAGRTQAVHMALRLAAEQQYGKKTIADATRLLAGKSVFCPDFTSIETVLPILYEGGEPVFIDALEENWCMDPEALEIAFEKYPDVKIVITSGVYGFSGSIQEIRDICREHGALLIEDATESFFAERERTITDDVPACECKVAARYPSPNPPDNLTQRRVIQGATGSPQIGDYTVVGLDAGWNKGGGGAVLLTEYTEEADKARRILGTAKEDTPWHQHEIVYYDYRMPEIVATLAKDSLTQIDGYFSRKREIYERYLKAFDPGMITMNEPSSEDDGSSNYSSNHSSNCSSNYSTSAILLESAIPFREIRTQREYTYHSLHGTASPMEMVEALQAFGAEAFPVYKPMHMQPLFMDCDQISLDGSIRDYEDREVEDLFPRHNAAKYLFEHGVCLPGSVDMTEDEQAQVIQIVQACFNGADMKEVRKACGSPSL